jgi:fructose-1-phosphate kinase PfkB-like protein
VTLESYSAKVKTSGEFVDDLIVKMRETDAPEVMIRTADDVLRPFLAILDEQEDAHRANPTEGSGEDMVAAIDSLVATMMMNAISRMNAPDQFDAAVDQAQDMINHVTAMLSQSIHSAFTPPGASH